MRSGPRRSASEENSARNAYDFLETSAYNAIASEQDPNKRMSEIEKFTARLSRSRSSRDQITQLALYSLRQLNQPQRLVAYGEKTLAANPDSIPTLLMMADAYAGDPKDAAKAATYANKVLTLVGPNPAGDDKTKKSYAGLAHTTLGRAELNQEKLVAAVADLKTAVGLLQDDPQDQQPALFYLGYAYAKQNHKADAVAALQKAAAINGPYQGPAKDMLAKVSAAGPATEEMISGVNRLLPRREPRTEFRSGFVSSACVDEWRFAQTLPSRMMVAERTIEGELLF